MTTTLQRPLKRSNPIRPAKSLRGDIQALRALAVGVVLLNHLWPEHLPGGYIGVDIFFVISGYLITAHLLREVVSTGRIRLAKFWTNRARRLLPAAMTVLLFTVVVTAVCLPITNQQSSFDQIGAAGAYFLNWLLAASAVDYFAQGSALSPVTHYWSLSVEEQFYIVWPILLLLVAVATRKLSGRGRTLALASVVALVGIASFTWANYSVSTTPAAAYFETTGRAWEFAAGGLLAFLPTLSSRLRAVAVPVVWAGWVTLAVAAYSFGPASDIPGAPALVPVLATAAIILAGNIKSSWSPHRLTSLRPIQTLGDISYSVYLWHWPLIVAAPFILRREIFATDKVIILALTLVLALLSKRYIEDPVRAAPLPFLKSPRHVLGMTAVAVAITLAGTMFASAQIDLRAQDTAERLHSQSVSPDPCFGAQAFLSGEACSNSHVLTDPDAALLSWSSQDIQVANGTTCMQDREATKVETCSFGVQKGEQSVDVALFGDSHAGMWAHMLDAIAPEKSIRVTAFVKSACSPTLDPNVGYKRDSTHDPQCRVWREAAIAQIAADPSVDVVVTSAIDRSYAVRHGRDGEHQMDSGAGYAEAWNVFLDAGKRVLVINEVPERLELIPECIARSGVADDPCTVPAEIVAEPGPLRKAANSIRRAGFEFVDFEGDFCDSTVCHAVIGGIPAYIDASHLSAPFARSTASAFRSMTIFDAQPDEIGRVAK